MHLLSMVADRLWLVKDGHVSVYEEDLQAYRKMLLSNDKPAKKDKDAKKAEKPKVKRPSQDQIKALRADVRKCEERMSKIDEMRDKLAKKLADPVLYEEARKGELETWNKKYAEVMEAHGRAETMWMTALEKLEAANAS
jgi:ATP-binding cassette subfamily F protein 3